MNNIGMKLKFSISIFLVIIMGISANSQNLTIGTSVDKNKYVRKSMISTIVHIPVYPSNHSLIRRNFINSISGSFIHVIN